MEAIRYITEIDEVGHLKETPTIKELKGQEVEVIIYLHMNRSQIKANHNKLRNKIKSRGKPLSKYVIEERETSR